MMGDAARNIFGYLSGYSLSIGADRLDSVGKLALGSEKGSEYALAVEIDSFPEFSPRNNMVSG
jgi:hypothetical protein